MLLQVIKCPSVGSSIIEMETQSPVFNDTTTTGVKDIQSSRRLAKDISVSYWCPTRFKTAKWTNEMPVCCQVYTLNPRDYTKGCDSQQVDTRSVVHGLTLWCIQ